MHDTLTNFSSAFHSWTICLDTLFIGWQSLLAPGSLACLLQQQGPTSSFCKLFYLEGSWEGKGSPCVWVYGLCRTSGFPVGDLCCLTCSFFPKAILGKVHEFAGQIVLRLKILHLEFYLRPTFRGKNSKQPFLIFKEKPQYRKRRSWLWDTGQSVTLSA